MEYTSINVRLSREEFEALREAADKEYRHPREQARWLLRQVLVQEIGATQTQPVVNNEELAFA